MKDAAIDSGCLWPRNKSSLHAPQRFNRLYGWAALPHSSSLSQFSGWVSNQRLDHQWRDWNDFQRLRRNCRYKGFEGGFQATLFLEAEIAVPVGAKIHGSGAAEETAVVRTETVWPSGVWDRCFSAIYFERKFEALKKIRKRKLIWRDEESAESNRNNMHEPETSHREKHNKRKTVYR